MTAAARRIAATLPVLFLLFTLNGCAQKEAAPPAAFRVALITPGPITDKGWSASAYEGLKQIEKELGAEVVQVEGGGTSQHAGTFRNLAQQGYHVIFGHASEYDDPARSVAKDFPKTTFVIMNGRSTAPNLSPIQFQAGQATYLSGMVAAGMSKTGKIGLVGGPEIPVIREAFRSFEKGAKAFNRDVSVKIVFTGNGDDAAKAKQAAQALLGQGADVLMHNANAAGLGVFQAVTEKKDAYVIGANADQSELATPQNLGSFILDVPSAMLAVARAVKEGKGEGKPFAAGLKDGAVSFKYNPKFQGTVPADLKARVEQARADIIAGTVDPKA